MRPSFCDLFHISRTLLLPSRACLTTSRDRTHEIPRNRHDSDSLGIQLTACHVSKFLSLETSVQIHSSVRDEDVFILQSPSPPDINDHLMELLIMISGESAAFATSVRPC